MRKKAIAEEVSKDITTEDFTHRWNDAVVSLDDYKRLVQEHQDWVEEQEKKAAADSTPSTSKRSKKNT